ncbi:MAG TPA: restriction endonuclease subunit S [Gammaproteobacteria bacterium]|nr:restriction endonuclease subunit S [Gammaproteobacteria bacterium]
MSWHKVKLKTLLSQPVQNGYSPVCPEEPNGKWVLGLGALSGSGLDSTQIKPAPVDDSKVDNFLLRPGDFLVSRSNTRDKVGRSALFKGEIKNCSYPDLMMRFRINETTIYPEFLEMYLRSHRTVKYFQRSASGTSGTMVKINKRVVENLKVPLPPMPEQTAIADLLSTWDAAIEKTEKLIAAKEKRFLWLRAQLLTPEADWKHLKLTTVCSIKKGQQLSKVDMIESGRYYVLNGGISPSGYTDKWNTPENTITISEGGNSCGFVSFNKEPFWSGGHCYSLIKLSRDINPFFLYHFLKCNEHKIMRLRVGSGLPNIQRKDIENIHISFPKSLQQRQISEALNTAFQEIEILCDMVKAFHRQKRGLMQKLLTGQWRAPSHPPPPPSFPRKRESREQGTMIDQYDCHTTLDAGSRPA